VTTGMIGDRLSAALSASSHDAEWLASQTSIDQHRIDALLASESGAVLQEIAAMADALGLEAAFLAFGDESVFAMRSDDDEAAEIAKLECKRALDALLGLEALVG
jgi:hypothetical protein